jgi:hypothetical protein
LSHNTSLYRIDASVSSLRQALDALQEELLDVSEILQGSEEKKQLSQESFFQSG